MLNQLVNKGACGQANIICTGADYCELDIKELKSIWVAPYGYKFPSNIQNSNEFELAMLQGEVVALNLTPKGGVKGVAYTTDANRVKTYSGGEKALIGKNPFQVDLTFEGGIQNYQSFITLEKRNKHSIFLVDEKGTVFMAKNKAGLLGGLNAPFFHVEAYKGMSGSEGGDFMVQFQLEREQFDTELVALQIGKMDFNPNTELTCLAEVIAQPLSAQINGLDVFDFQVKQLADQAIVNGLSLSEFDVKVNGTTVAGTFTSPSAGVYRFTRTAGTFATGETVEATVNPQYVGVYGYKGSGSFLALAL